MNGEKLLTAGQVAGGMMEGKELLSVKEASQVTGLPESLIRARVRKQAHDPIPHIRTGSFLRIYAQGLTAWMACHSKGEKGNGSN